MTAGAMTPDERDEAIVEALARLLARDLTEHPPADIDEPENEEDRQEAA